jgi:hypothetical protein
MMRTLFIIRGLAHPKRISIGVAITRGEGTATLMTMEDPIKWLLVSGVTTVEGMRTAMVDIATTIETRPVQASRHIGLDPRKISINRQTRFLMDLAICTFTSTQRGGGNPIIS